MHAYYDRIELVIENEHYLPVCYERLGDYRYSNSLSHLLPDNNLYTLTLYAHWFICKIFREVSGCIIEWNPQRNMDAVVYIARSQFEWALGQFMQQCYGESTFSECTALGKFIQDMFVLVEYPIALPTGILSGGELYDYQKEGVKWMISRERFADTRLIVHRKEPDIVVQLPEWVFDWAPPAFVLADDPGLGKTIQVIALCVLRGGRTLLVAQPSLLAQWEVEFQRFAPHINVVSGTRSLTDETVDVRMISPLMLIKQPVDSFDNFDRLVVDEAHQLYKNMVSKTYQGINRLRNHLKYTWFLTGTPTEVFSGTSPKFLPAVSRRWQPTLVLQRRATPSLVKMPRVLSLDIEFDLHSEEQVVSQHMRTVLRDSVKQTASMSRLFLFGQVRLVSSCPTAVSERALIICGIGQDDVAHEQPTLSSAQEAFLAENPECAICLDLYDDPCMIRKCIHAFCGGCITSLKQNKCPLCRREFAPADLVPLDAAGSLAISLKHGSGGIVAPETVKIAAEALSEPSSRIMAAVKLLQNLLETPQKTQVVIFTSFGASVPPLQAALKAVGLDSRRFVGSMSRNARKRAYREFISGHVPILVLTVRTGAVGLNLQNASHLVFLEPVISKTVRTQAVARLVRIGQRADEVQVHTIVARNTMDTLIHKSPVENRMSVDNMSFYLAGV